MDKKSKKSDGRGIKCLWNEMRRESDERRWCTVVEKEKSKWCWTPESFSVNCASLMRNWRERDERGGLLVERRRKGKRDGIETEREQNGTKRPNTLKATKSEAFQPGLLTIISHRGEGEKKWADAQSQVFTAAKLHCSLQTSLALSLSLSPSSPLMLGDAGLQCCTAVCA